MSDNIAENLERLGLSQYLERLLEEGFTQWETILDIQEPDLAALGFKLGHRRTLQRAIATARGVPESDPIPWLYQSGLSEDAGDDGDDASSIRGYKSDYKGAQQKRKYRRHPRPDEHAPGKPPSAYVTFANRVRENLQGESKSFTDIARLVGEKWKMLDPAEKEKIENEAAEKKERYNQELAEYKKTEHYHTYVQYLSDFKAKMNKESGGESSSFPPSSDVPRKRQRVEEFPAQSAEHSPSLASSTAGVSGYSPIEGANTARLPPHQSSQDHSYNPTGSSIAAGHYAEFHGRRESYAGPFTQPSTPASQMASPLNFNELSGVAQSLKSYQTSSGPPSAYEAITLSYRGSPNRVPPPHQPYEQSRLSSPMGHSSESMDSVMLPKILPQPPHIQPPLSYSRGQPSPKDSPSHSSNQQRRSDSVSSVNYSQRPPLHSTETFSTQASISSSGSSSVPSLTPAASLDSEGRLIHVSGMRALPPLRDPSPQQPSPASYFGHRPQDSASYRIQNPPLSPHREQLPPIGQSGNVSEQQPRNPIGPPDQS